MILVFDTNIFLQRHRNLWELLDYFPTNQTPPGFLIATDIDGIIEEDYVSHQNNWADYDIETIISKILDGSSLFVIRPQVHLPNILKRRLWQNGCVTPMELQLFSVAAGNQGILVSPNTAKDNPIHRNYLQPGVLGNIQDNGVGPCVLTLAEILRLLRLPHEYSPDSLHELERFISDYRSSQRISEEREFLEFKNPENDFLSQRLLRKAVQAVCGMLNTRDGYVIIGVDDESGMICPFTPRYEKNQDLISVDHVEQCIYAEIDRIAPIPGEMVHVWPLMDASNQKCVFVIHVFKGNREYFYRDKEENNWKLGQIKWIRNGNRTIPAPNLNSQ
jgi:hypothetical protein